jgi:hypothetical protein
MKGLIIRLAFSALLPIFIPITTNTIHAQCLSGNCRTGTGTYRFANGDEYAGSWLNGQMNGKGVYQFANNRERYEGQFKAGKYEGQGTMYYPDGAKYTGAWKANRRNGIGKLIDPNGGITEGMWEMSKYIGPAPNTTASKPPKPTNKPTGTATTPAKPNGSSTANTVPSTVNTTGKPRHKNDIAGMSNGNKVFLGNGRGYFDYPDGSRWIGEFKNGYPQGQGVCYYSNNDRYDGAWANNAPNGRGIMYFASGRVYGAVWANGAPIQEMDSNEVIPSDPVKVQASKNVKIYAVVVGIGRYTAMPSLKFTDDDAYRFYSFLRSPEGGALPDDQITVLVDEAATRQGILTALRQMFLKADANDVVLFYYSGHGVEGNFLPVDFDGYNNKLRHDEIKKIFLESKAKHKICIADACHSGSLGLGEGFAAKGPATVSLERFYQAFEDSDGGIALLMSSKSEELSLEDHGLRQGVFTYYILQGLKGKADNNNDQIITVRELYSFVRGRVYEYTAGAQTPVLTGKFDDAMPVAVKGQ